MHEFILANKEIFKILYSVIILLICTIIVLKTDKLFQLSLHKGIRYFRNAFFFFGIAFFTRYFLGSSFVLSLPLADYSSLIDFLFEFFLIIGGFSLIYSLLWKKIENPKEDYFSSLLNKKILVFYLMAFIIAFLDYLWTTHTIMFFSQIILFLIAIMISFNNYRQRGKKYRFLKFYFFAMLLSLLAWILNTIAALYLQWDKTILVGVYLSNIIIFFLFLYGVLKITKRKN